MLYSLVVVCFYDFISENIISISNFQLHLPHTTSCNKMIFTSLISLALLPALSKATLVPAANGPYSVALKTLELTDTSRFNDLNPENSTTVRRMMTSVFLPIEKDLTDKLCHREIVPLMTPAVAARYAKNLEDDGLPHIPFDSFQLEVCALSRNRTCVRGRGKKRYPVVLFSPGIGDSRLLYSAMARSLASNGYIVVTVDHTYEAYFVEFPDGTVTPGVKISNDTAFVQKVVAVSASRKPPSKSERHLLTHNFNFID